MIVGELPCIKKDLDYTEIFLKKRSNALATDLSKKDGT